MRKLVWILLVAFATASWAQEAPDTACEKSLQSERAQFQVIPSDRVPSVGEQFKEYVHELVELGGVLDQLGIEMTGQVVELIQGRDLNAVTSGSAGGYPIRHYLDGAAVMNALKPKGSFALEVVYPGPHYQHGFYRDDNEKFQQFSIIDHVVGHNHFALKSGFPHYRVAQGMEVSRELDDLLRRLYSSYDKDEVQRYYLWALTLSRLMDWYTPYYQPVEEFEPQLNVGKVDLLGRTRQQTQRHPRRPTENILPAFAANIAPYQPEWKREILEMIHKIMSFRPALVHTQIMNEGWASIMQEIIPRHTKKNHGLDFWMQAQHVMQGEKSPNLRDPYSLGVFCWRRLKEKFEHRPEIAALSKQIEKDRAFIQYAEEIIATHDDDQFLRLAMDQTFLDRYNLAVVRKAKQKEFVNLPPPNTNQPVTQWVVVTRDREKVVQAIIDMVLKPKYIFNPRVRLMDFVRPQSGEVDLVLDDEVSNAVAIEKTTLGPALFAMAQVIDKSVSLTCNLAEEVMETVDEQQDFGPWGGLRTVSRNKQVLKPFRARVVVSVAGEVKVYRVQSKTDEVLDENLSKEFAQNMKSYFEDLYLDSPSELTQALENSSLGRLVSKHVASHMDNSPYGSLLVHAPNAAGALAEYKAKVSQRMLSAMELAAQGKGQIRMVGQSLRVRALPSPMNISFDMQHLQQVFEEQPGAPLDVHRTFAKKGPLGDFQGEEGTVGGVGGARPGDRFWGPDRPKGEGEQGTKPGEDPNDLSWVDIPPDLYAKFLGERVRLPILNRKPGLSRTEKTKPAKRTNRLHGQAKPREITENAFKRGVGAVLAEGGNPFDHVEDTFETGFANLLPRDWVVKSTKVVKKPDVRAVVTFILDSSGSTMQFMESFKRFVNDIEILIRANYKGFDFRYIVFDTQAHVLKNQDEFFRSQLGGGTAYLTGLERNLELFRDQYPRSLWDRYTFLMGDMEDFSPQESFAKIKQTLQESEFMGVVAGLNWPDGADGLELLSAVRSEISSNKQLGVTILDSKGGYQFQNIREVLRNDDMED